MYPTLGIADFRTQRDDKSLLTKSITSFKRRGDDLTNEPSLIITPILPFLIIATLVLMDNMGINSLIRL